MNSNCIWILVDLTVLRVYVYMHRCQRGEHWSGNKSNHAWRREGDPHIPFSVITIDRFTHRKELSWGNHFHTCTHTDCLCLQRGTLIFSKVETCQFPSPWSHTHTFPPGKWWHGSKEVRVTRGPVVRSRYHSTLCDSPRTARNFQLPPSCFQSRHHLSNVLVSSNPAWVLA